MRKELKWSDLCLQPKSAATTFSLTSSFRMMLDQFFPQLLKVNLMFVWSFRKFRVGLGKVLLLLWQAASMFGCGFLPNNTADHFVSVLVVKKKKVLLHWLQVKLWASGHLSNFDYIMLLNYLCGRTFSNPNHYPVLPWVSWPTTNICARIRIF